MSKAARWVGAAWVAASAVACDEGLSQNDVEELAALELTSARIPASPTNAYADDAAAAALGRTIFFDRRFSSDGTVACADCHDPTAGFSDDRRLSKGVREQEGARHAMPITSGALLPFLLWDGRADTVWRQPLFAFENPREMDFPRTDVARLVSTHLKSEYEAVFGPLPDLAEVSAGVRVEDEAWTALDDAKKDAVQRVFVNVGKAIEAYERLLVCKDTRFDRWARGEGQLTQDELDGADQFRRSGCQNCHDGAAFSDGAFHNLGLIRVADANRDVGREEGLAFLLTDPLNGAGAYSDDPIFGALRLAEAASEERTRGSFRTASLRGVTQRTRFGHLGRQTDLEEFITDTYRRGGRGGGRGRGNDDDAIVGTLDPILDRVNVDGGEARSIATFLGTLECPTPDAALLAP